MSSLFSGSFRRGPERGREDHPAAPTTSFDGRFTEGRVCLTGDYLQVDLVDCGNMTLNMLHCDQLMLGESSGRSPRWLSLRFLRYRHFAGREEAITGMALVKVGLHGAHDLREAQDLYAHLTSRFPWLRPPTPSTGDAARPRPEGGTKPSPRGAGMEENEGRPPPPDTEAVPTKERRFPPSPVSADRAGDWVGFVPGPHTQELHEEVHHRRREAERR